MKRKYQIYDEVSRTFIMLDPSKQHEWNQIDDIWKLMTAICTYEHEMLIEFKLNKTCGKSNIDLDGIFKGYSETILGTFWEYSGNGMCITLYILCIFCVHSGNILEIF